MSSRRNNRVLLVLAIAGNLSGCADYFNHRDTITFGAGNAMEANKGIHTVDPFPRSARNTQISTDGKVINGVIRDYQAGSSQPPVILPAGPPPTMGAAPYGG